MAGNIFISYRRGDDPGFAQAIYQRLEQEFPGESLFMDVEGHIKPGDDFVAVLNEQVAQCDVLLAIIGERWLDARDADGNRRLEKEDDFVRIEIASALDLGKRVIPVLVNQAGMPRADDLPQSLKPLARRNAVAIRPTRFKADSQGLINALKDALALAEAERAAKSQPSVEALRKFLGKFGGYAAEAKAALDARKKVAEAARQADEKMRAETEAWARVAASTDLAKLQGTRRGMMKGFIIGAAVTGGGILYSATVPGAFIWRQIYETQIYEQSLRTFTGHTGVVWSVGFSPDGALALSGSDDKTLKLWDVASGRELRTFMGHTGSVFSVAFSPDGARALSGSDDKTLKLRDIASGRELRTFTGHADGVSSVVFSPDGALALSGSYDNTLKLWDVASGRELRTFMGHTGSVYSVAFSPDGALALSGSDDQTLRLWDVASGRELRTFMGHTDLVRSVVFSPDGARALSGSGDGRLKLWDVASGRELRTFTGHRVSVRSVAFSPDGAHALSGGGALLGSYDSTLKLWDLSPWLATR